jgi:hypothetical protein
MAALASKCTAIVDEVRKTLAVVDAEGNNTADWSTLQADEVSASVVVWAYVGRCQCCNQSRLPLDTVSIPLEPCVQLAAALEAAKTADGTNTTSLPAPLHTGSSGSGGGSSSLPPANVPPASTYLSPYNIRVGPATSGARSHKAGTSFVPAAGGTLTYGTTAAARGRPPMVSVAVALGLSAGTYRDPAPDGEGAEDVDGGEDGEDGAGGNGEVLNRSELKKMSQRLLRYRKRYTHIPGLAPLAGQAAGGAGGAGRAGDADGDGADSDGGSKGQGGAAAAGGRAAKQRSRAGAEAAVMQLTGRESAGGAGSRPVSRGHRDSHVSGAGGGLPRSSSRARI